MKRTNLYGFEEEIPLEPYAVTIIKIIITCLILIFGIISVGAGVSLSTVSDISGSANFDEIKPFYELMRSISLIGGVPAAAIAIGGIVVIVLKNKIGFIIYMVLTVLIFADSGMCGLALFTFYYLIDGACYQIVQNCWECNVEAPSNATDPATWVNQYCINEAWVNGTVRCYYDPDPVKVVCDDSDLKILLVSSALFAASVFAFVLLVLSLIMAIIICRNRPREEQPENLVKTNNLDRNQFQFYNETVNKQHQFEMDEAKRLETRLREAPPPRIPTNNNYMSAPSRQKVIPSPTPTQKARKGLPPITVQQRPDNDKISLVRSDREEEEDSEGPYRG